LDKVKFELTFEKDFDCVIINNILEDSLRQAEKLVSDFLGITL